MVQTGMRICFLFNHYAAHQVAHAAPFAFELSRRYEKADVVVACTSDALRAAVLRIAALYPKHRVEFVQLEIPLSERIVTALLTRFTFLAKKRMLARNLDFFRGFDAIVTPERTVLLLRTKYGLERVKLINTRHGQGDRMGSFDDRTLEVDLTLVAGRKYVDRFADYGILREGHYAIVGYPKFEVCGNHGPPARLWANDNPVVLYNPHFDPRESSWPSQGHAVLDWFAAHPEYNLVFAPHVVLFERAWKHAAWIPRRIRGLPNIHIDVGSDASIDMTYTRAAAIYLGDSSSQVYEFIEVPRPCVFIDAQGARAANPNKYAHWRFGPVISSAAELGPALIAAREGFPAYAEEQRTAFAYTFSSEPGRSAGQRGADAIAEFLEKGRIDSPGFLAH